MDRALTLFGEHLERLRALAPVKTICMHGSPLSKWDNRKLWEQYDYRDHSIVAEPYFDVNYSKVFYITDTGRSWPKTESFPAGSSSTHIPSGGILPAFPGSGNWSSRTSRI